MIFAPFIIDRLSNNEQGRLLRSISVQTNVVEGVLKLDAGECEKITTLGFASLTFSHAYPPDIYERYVQQVLLDSQAATQLVLDRIRSAGHDAEFNEAFVCELHAVFTKTACITTHRMGNDVKSVYIGRGRFKFLSNHVFARNGAFHAYCRPEEVSAEMRKIFDMLEVGSRLVSVASSNRLFIQNYIKNIQQAPENGIWLAAWFHHRFVNIHPFRVCLVAISRLHLTNRTRMVMAE